MPNWCFSSAKLDFRCFKRELEPPYGYGSLDYGRHPVRKPYDMNFVKNEI